MTTWYIYILVIYYILWPFGICYGHLVHICYGHLGFVMVIWYTYFVVFWYIFTRFETLYQEKSGNPAIEMKIGRSISIAKLEPSPLCQNEDPPAEEDFFKLNKRKTISLLRSRVARWYIFKPKIPI
jgi:hypothetical protein